MKLSKYKRNIDRWAWRCYILSCRNYKKYKSIRIGSFFEGFNISIADILKVIIKRLSGENLTSIVKFFNSKFERTIWKVLNKFHSIIPNANYENARFGGPGFIVQVDETMLNYKCKSHRGRSSSNRTDAICIVECRRGINRAFACTIPNKNAETIVPIIERLVIPGSIIWTDEHRAYGSLNDIFRHSTVCHKYEFINRIDGTNTQAVESFNNALKLEIKRQKGVKTYKREDFIRVFLFMFNNSENLLKVGLNLIKTI
ncbi:hypothetical protein DMUE_6138 [Dictyocoela muelleri]|nr:hypothetical protein DMUE_6138 [Dictyocoela muelleri]